MRNRYLGSALTALALVIGLGGCETKRVTESMAQVDQTAGKADALAGSLRNQTGSARKSVSFTDEQWVNTRPIAIKRGLPPARDCELGYNESKTLQQFAQWLSDHCSKTPVKVMPDALDGGASYLKSRSQPQKGPASPPTVAGASDSIADLFPGAAGGTAVPPAAVSSYYGGARSTVTTQYYGKLSGLLDTVTGSLGLSWRYDPAAGVIKIFYLETRQFPIYAFDKSTNFKSEVKSGMSSSTGASSSGTGQGATSSSGISGESGSNQSTEVTMASQLLADIESNVRSMLTLGQMSFSRTTGTLSITDRPDVLDRVQEYLDEENERITKNILINVEVISVKLSDTDQYGIDWSLVYKSVNGKWGFGLSNTFPGIGQGAVSSSVSILDTASSPWAGSKAIIQALSQQGRISSYRAPSVTTLNLQAAPIQIGKVKGYLQSSQTTQSANVGSTTSLIPGSITSGFNMSLIPMVMPANQLLMQLMVNMTGDPLFEEISAGDSKIQNPSYDAQIINQAVKLRSGQTLVLSGFDETTVNASKSGTFSPSNFLFGGGGTSAKNRDVIVLMITPIIME
ncbi:PilN family type IVB pilus formation outer membrane protein [Pseudomonas chlororaphis]|uniref:PilN family type IVB pilus formation outer membrane protein n=1 Tax=Pseudomonas chlororaphis TaxID=587753 RepID=UPI002D791172|nr:PilN family type IVB pilus formation outer membrane protein [Pseudomonas chlororaphis]